ncbi:DUF397 domain-containing protein [Streptomyces sp. NPDC048171]|uniref:DUF397 domain-containing protein n=1 Tax=unclassified Streptomyces TaxID=2593676 RepID=UPI00136ADE61|nr:DUF397 domain-containing protein [Streptomyces sp. SID5789]MZE71727.1 DUF397 domain-containing protein [Streptomyces sp. SID5789]
MTSALKWFKSSYSGSDEPDCVEIAIPPTTPTIHVRDSKNPTAANLTFTGASWTAFVHTVTTATRRA